MSFSGELAFQSNSKIPKNFYSFVNNELRVSGIENRWSFRTKRATPSNSERTRHPSLPREMATAYLTGAAYEPRLRTNSPLRKMMENMRKMTLPALPII
jgi:hypothetical protein